jgi:hypothetical protein
VERVVGVLWEDHRCSQWRAAGRTTVGEAGFLPEESHVGKRRWR